MTSYQIRLVDPRVDPQSAPWHDVDADDDMHAIEQLVPGLLAQHRRLEKSVLVAVCGGGPGPRMHRVHVKPGPKMLPDVLSPRDIFAVIEDRRELYGMRLVDLAEETGISTSRLSEILRSKSQACTWHQLDLLSRAVGFRMGFSPTVLGE